MKIQDRVPPNNFQLYVHTPEKAYYSKSTLQLTYAPATIAHTPGNVHSGNAPFNYIHQENLCN
jgi:hypothetical protein